MTRPAPKLARGCPSGSPSRVLILTACLFFACAGGGNSEPSILVVHVEGVRFDPRTDSPVVLLEESAGSGRRLPIWIGVNEARSIAMEIGKIDSPRPNTHDLLVDVLGTMSGKLERVVITELRDNVYYAVLEISIGGRRLVVDSRPSDAIAIALRTGSPVTVSAELLEATSSEDSDAPSAEIFWSPQADTRLSESRSY